MAEAAYYQLNLTLPPTELGEDEKSHESNVYGVYGSYEVYALSFPVLRTLALAFLVEMGLSREINILEVALFFAGQA